MDREGCSTYQAAAPFRLAVSDPSPQGGLNKKQGWQPAMSYTLESVPMFFSFSRTFGNTTRPSLLLLLERVSPLTPVPVLVLQQKAALFG